MYIHIFKVLRRIVPLNSCRENENEEMQFHCMNYIVWDYHVSKIYLKKINGSIC